MTAQRIRMVVIGCGGAARAFHINRIIEQFSDRLEIAALCEPSPDAAHATVQLFESLGKQAPPNQPDLDRLLQERAAELDVALIATPHAQHTEQITACMEAGLDVLVEKPLAITIEDIEQLIKTRDRTGRLLVVAYDGGLSPYVHTAADLIRSGQLGALRGINAMVWQNWRVNAAGTWQEQPEISGGGFMFNTGAHMLNTVLHIAGEPFVEVCALQDSFDRRVEVQAVVMGRLRSGAIVTMHGAGDTGVDGCESEVRVFGTQGMMRTGIWGEFLELMPHNSLQFEPVPVPRRQSTWLHFLMVRDGAMANPCPPEASLQVAYLWAAIQESAARNGTPVAVSPGG